MSVTVRAVPDGQLLQEASVLVAKVLGSPTRFSSRSQFHNWLTQGGMASLVKAKAMKPLRYADPWSSLETVVGILRLFGTRRPPESYGRRLVERYTRRLESLVRYAADEHPRAPQGEPTTVNGKTYKPGEFIPHAEIEAESKSLESKLKQFRSLAGANKLAKAKEANKAALAKDAAPAPSDGAKTLVDLYARAGKPGLTTDEIDRVLSSPTVQAMSGAKLKAMAMSIDVAPGTLNREQLLAKIRANIANRAGTHGRVKI